MNSTSLSKGMVDSLIASIQDGDVDDYLKDIATACFKRGQVIGVIPEKKDAAPVRKRVATAPSSKVNDAKVIRDRKARLTTTEKTKPYTGPRKKTFPQSKGPGWWPVAPATNVLASERYVEHGGKTYRRKDFIGQEFTIQPGTYKDDRFDGMTATITGAGARAFKVKFPPGTGPKGPGQNNVGEVAFIDYRNADYLFG